MKMTTKTRQYVKPATKIATWYIRAHARRICELPEQSLKLILGSVRAWGISLKKQL